MALTFLALGSNLGDRRAHLYTAAQALHEHPHVHVAQASPVYESAAHTLDSSGEQPAFLNAVVQANTSLSPNALLQAAQQMERDAGRVDDRERWAPRPLDVDLLTYGRLVRTSETLTLPHPRLAERRFVLRPWADVAPNLWVPAPFEQTVETLLSRCPDTAALRKTSWRLPQAASHPPSPHDDAPF